MWFVGFSVKACLGSHQMYPFSLNITHPYNLEKAWLLFYLHYFSVSYFEMWKPHKSDFWENPTENSLIFHFISFGYSSSQLWWPELCDFPLGSHSVISGVGCCSGLPLAFCGLPLHSLPLLCLRPLLSHQWCDLTEKFKCKGCLGVACMNV